jgi:hypothetical protein
VQNLIGNAGFWAVDRREGKMKSRRWMTKLGILAVVAFGMGGFQFQMLFAKEKSVYLDPNDPTLRLFQTIDNSHNGRVTDFYVIADVYRDPANPNEELQHILKADYDKNRGFGKLHVYVRSVGKIQPEQLKTYTAKEFYEFGLSDQEKYMKSEPGVFGKAGDVYLRASSDRPLASMPVTDEVRKNYERLVTQHLLPALEKK